MRHQPTTIKARIKYLKFHKNNSATTQMVQFDSDAAQQHIR